MAVLAARNLRKAYGHVTALQDVNFSMNKGECIALLGPNGAGKTTICDILSGLIRADQGSVTIDDLTYPHHHKKIQQIIGVHQQGCNLYGKYTIEETFDLFASFYNKTGSNRSLIKRLLLDEKKYSRIEALSFGQKQRVYLGCALVHEPKLLLLDEPTTGLDLQSRHVIWQLIEEQVSRGISVLLTTHNMEEAKRLADHILILDQGNIITQGNCRSIIENTCGKEVVSFRIKDNCQDIFCELKEIIPWIEKSKKIGNRFYMTTNQSANLIKDLSIAHEKLNFMDSLTLNETSLEDVFLKLTGRAITHD